MYQIPKMAVIAIVLAGSLAACATSRDEANKMFACTYEATLEEETTVLEVVDTLVYTHGTFMDDGYGTNTQRFFTEKVMTLNNVAGLTLPAGKIIIPKRCDEPDPQKS